MNYKEILADYKRNSKLKFCFHRDKSLCSGKIKAAHSIQKEKILTQLTSTINKNEVLYSLDSVKSDENFQGVELIPIGKKKASIFNGFCDYHDSKLFSAIENEDITFTEEQNFLITYRSFAHSYHQISEVYNYYSSNADFIKEFPKDYLEYHTRTTELSIIRLSKYKMILDNLMDSKNYSSINYHYRIIKPFVPIAASSILRTVYTYRNQFIYEGEDYAKVILNIIPDGDRTVILLSQFKEDKLGQILFDDLKSLPEKEFTHAITSLIIFCTENVFFSPKLWDRLSHADKQHFLYERTMCGRHGAQLNSFFRSKFDLFN
jgi:hypothetical protein|tara:strand:- start:1535 stop:2491 length:957 start_codon:yes stop_codon:yes gene_type:complete